MMWRQPREHRCYFGDEPVDLVYLDTPFKSDQGYNNPPAYERLLMALRRNDPPVPEPPEVQPSIGIGLLQQQLEKGRSLLINRPLCKDEYASWELITRNYLEKAFGRHSPNVRSVIDVGKFGMVPIEGEAQRERHRAESLQTQLSRLDGLIELLATEVQLQGHRTIKREVEVIGHRIFLVHGHDQAALQETARFLERLDKDIVILREQPNQGRTIIEKFEEYADVGFAVVLLTADDRGATMAQPYDAQKPRARQNVILELGYFLGRLGRNRVCALYRSGVEIPSDYAGVLFTELDEGGGWRLQLAKELKAAGLPVDMNNAL
jgi:predicted nucleotide-binding protein